MTMWERATHRCILMRTEGFAGQLEVACRGRSGGKLLSRGNKSVAVLSAAFFRRSPGVEKLGEAFQAFYRQFLDKVAPGTELEAATKYFKDKTAAS